MSQCNFNKMFLNFQDNNISIFDFCLETINKVQIKVLKVELTYEPECCPHCEATNNKTIVKCGWKTINIKTLPITEQNVYLRLKKQRFKYKSCSYTLLAQTEIIDKNCSISRDVKYSIANKLTEIISLKSIAKQYNVSSTTVQRVINNGFSKYYVNRKELPQVLCFDEFKSVKQCEGSMSFI